MQKKKKKETAATGLAGHRSATVFVVWGSNPRPGSKAFYVRNVGDRRPPTSTIRAHFTLPPVRECYKSCKLTFGENPIF